MADVSVLILYDRDKKIYLQHRSNYKSRWAGYWGTFGGGIEEGETVEAALQREIMEELQYQIMKPELLYVQSLELDKKHVHVEFYDGNQTLVPSPDECQDARWVSVEEALTLKLIPHEIEVLEKVRAFLIGK